MTDRPSPEDVLARAANYYNHDDAYSIADDCLTDLTAAGYSIVPTDELADLRRLRDAGVAWRAADATEWELLTGLIAAIDALGEAQR